MFAEEPFSGNPLAVVLDGAALSASEMQVVAREFNLSETTFLLAVAEGPNGFPVRIFTPEREVPFAGHPTLGTAWVIDHRVRTSPVGQVRLDLQVGSIPVLRDEASGLLWMTQRGPTFHDCYPAAEAAALLSLDEGEIDPAYPVQVVSTGLPFLLVPLVGLDAVKRAHVNFAELERWRRAGRVTFQFLFSRETYDRKHQINARMFANEVGVPEDPATGSANGCLAAYLVKHAYLGMSSVSVAVEQGFEIKRPSVLYLQACAISHATHSGSEPIAVRVGGRVWPVGEGTLYI